MGTAWEPAAPVSSGAALEILTIGAGRTLDGFQVRRMAIQDDAGVTFVDASERFFHCMECGAFLEAGMAGMQPFESEQS